MASIPSALMVFLIYWNLDHMVSGARGDSVSVFTSAGGAATLPCANVLSNDSQCSSTTWIYSGNRETVAVELVTHGKIKPDSKSRAERLSLPPNCSLHITNVTTEDAGLYTCQQYLTGGGGKVGGDAPVYLSVLQVSASPSQTEMETGSHVTLHCQLHTDDQCGASVRNAGVRLSWVDERQRELNNSTKRQITTTPQCYITMTLNLTPSQLPLPQRTWRCNLTARGEVTIANYTLRIKGVKTSTSVPKSITKTKTTRTSWTTMSGLNPSTTKTSVPLLVGVGVSVALLASVLLVVIIVVHRRRTNSGGEQKYRSTQSRTSTTAVQSPPPQNPSADVDEGSELHYAAFHHLNPAHSGPPATPCEDTVTYSTIMCGEDQNTSRTLDPNAVYSTVLKNNKAEN